MSQRAIAGAITAPTEPVALVPGRTVDLPLDDVMTRAFVGFRAVEVDGDADSELLLVSEQARGTRTLRVPYLVLDPSAGSAPIDLTAGAETDCLDAVVITGPDGAPLIVLACKPVGGDAAGLFAVDIAVAPPQMARLGVLDAAGRMSTGDIDGDGLADIIVHNKRVDGRGAGVAVQCAHHDTAPCTGDQRPGFTFTEAP